MFEDWQTLIVIHGEDGIDPGQLLRHEGAVRRYRPHQVQARRAQLFKQGGDDVTLLPPQVPAFPGMGIKSTDQQPGSRDAEAAAQVGLQDADDPA